MYAMLRVLLLFGLSIILAGCATSGTGTRSTAVQPLEFKTVPNTTSNNEVSDDGGYVSIRFEYLNYSNNESGFFRKFLLQKRKNVLITASINAPNIKYTLPIFYLETREAENFSKFQNQQGAWLLSKTFIDSEGEVSIGFKWTEVEDNDSGYIKDAIDQVGSLVAIFQPGTMTVISSVTNRIDEIIKKYSKSTYDLGSTSGYTIQGLSTIDKIILFQGNIAVSFENFINGLPSTTIDYQSRRITERSPYDYAMMSCKVTDSCFTNGDVSSSPFYKTIRPVVEMITNYREMPGKITYFQTTIIPEIRNLHLSPKDESAFKVYIANSYGLWQGAHNITDDDVDRAASLQVERAIPIQTLAYEFMNEWMGGSIEDNLVSGQSIRIVRDNTVLPNVFATNNITLEHLCTLQIIPATGSSFDASNSDPPTRNSVSFNTRIGYGGNQLENYKVTIAIRRNRVVSVTIRRPTESV